MARGTGVSGTNPRPNSDPTGWLKRTQTHMNREAKRIRAAGGNKGVGNPKPFKMPTVKTKAPRVNRTGK